MEIYSTIEKYAIVHVLELIMQADAIIHPNEEEYMNEVYGQLEITPEIFDHMELMDFQSAKKTIRKMNLLQQSEVKQMFEKMAIVDGFVDKREQKVIDSIFKK